MHEEMPWVRLPRHSRKSHMYKMQPRSRLNSATRRPPTATGAVPERISDSKPARLQPCRRDVPRLMIGFMDVLDRGDPVCLLENAIWINRLLIAYQRAIAIDANGITSPSCRTKYPPRSRATGAHTLLWSRHCLPSQHHIGTIRSED